MVQELLCTSHMVALSDSPLLLLVAPSDSSLLSFQSREPKDFFSCSHLSEAHTQFRVVAAEVS